MFEYFLAQGADPEALPRRAVTFHGDDALFGCTHGGRDVEMFVVLKLNFQAAIKSAASSASRKPTSREGS